MKILLLASLVLAAVVPPAFAEDKESFEQWRKAHEAQIEKQKAESSEKTAPKPKPPAAIRHEPKKVVKKPATPPTEKSVAEKPSATKEKADTTPPVVVETPSATEKPEPVKPPADAQSEAPVIKSEKPTPTPTPTPPAAQEKVEAKPNAEESSPASKEKPEETKAEDWNAKFQATYVYQYQPAFTAAYSGPNSLGPYASDGWTTTFTGFFGWRLPWQTGEVYFNPEVSSIVPLDQTLAGLAALQNGELQKGGSAAPKIYMARTFLRQTWGLGGDSQGVDSDLNQLAGTVEKNRFVLTFGWLSMLDIFDRNSYAADPRSLFLGFSTLTYMSYDYAADGRGYTFGLAGELYQDNWAFRFGHMAITIVPNGMDLNYVNIFKYFGEQLEVEHDHEIGGMQGKVRVLGYMSRAIAASWQDAINAGIAKGTPPDITTVRNEPRIKYGFGLSIEQSVTPSLALFFRGMQSDGATEEYSFTEADQSLSLGSSLNGVNWGRPKDTVGIVANANFLSTGHSAYLTMGGISSFLGDGKLNYGPEQVFETYYSFNLVKKLSLTWDYEHFINPGYNVSRGPMDVFGVRLHTEF